MRKLFNFITLICSLCFFITNNSYSDSTNYPECARTNAQISSLLKKMQSMRFASLADKVNYISLQFLNSPYAFNALGEGALGKYDNGPIYRTDVFDCETYVDTVLALALASDLQSFQNLIRKIRYNNGEVSYINRNHFTCLDWNLNNQRQNLVKDITTEIYNKNNQPVSKDAIAEIDKPNWYKNLPKDRIRQNKLSDSQKQKRLMDLRKQAIKVKKQTSKIAYIPLDVIFDTNQKANMQIVKQIPHGAIIEIIRPNWNLYKLIGTNLNVSHLGFVAWEDDVPYFIHASSDKLLVVKVPLVDYLRPYINSPTIKGINVQVIVPS